MDYFAGLDISNGRDAHVCVLDREGVVVYESKSERRRQRQSLIELSKAQSCRRIVFETGRIYADPLLHGLSQLSLPVVCAESRQAYQALKSLATHKTDRNDARGLAHLGSHWLLQARAREIALQAHALRSLISARKKLVGHRSDLGKPDPWSCGRVSGSDCPARSPPPSSTTLLEQARGSPVYLPPCAA